MGLRASILLSVLTANVYRKYLIEPFLWNMFYHLAKALVVLEYGPKSPAILGQPIEDEAFDTDETSADEASADEALADKASAGDTSAGDTSADEASADETSADDTSADETSTNETSADEETLKPNKGPTEPSASQSQSRNEWKPIIHNDIAPHHSTFSLNLIEVILIYLQSFSGMRTLTRSVSILPRNSEISAPHFFILLESRRTRSCQGLEVIRHLNI